jgi:hypothetical protein
LLQEISKQGRTGNEWSICYWRSPHKTQFVCSKGNWTYDDRIGQITIKSNDDKKSIRQVKW